MYRFGQNDGSTYVASSSSGVVNNNNNSNTNNNLNVNNLSSRAGIKRSVSQVQTTERRPMLSSATTTQPTSTSPISSQNYLYNNSNNSNGEFSNAFDPKIKDFQVKPF
jgi:hypothetical protein